MFHPIDMHPPLIQKLIEQFSEFPTVGPRTAARFVFYLLKLSKEETAELLNSISLLKEEVGFCSYCFKPFESRQNSDNHFCEICSDPRRNKALLCAVEKETDLEAIEKTKKYRGRYLILGGTISRFKKEDIENLKIKELSEIAKTPEVSEIIIATNPTTEGETTALYLERLLKPLNKKVTRLGRGLPVGGELEYADPETLKSALEGRK